MTWDELILFPTWDLALQVIIRLIIAAILSGAIGFERELKGKAAGLRTHMLIGLATTIIIMVSRLDGIPIAEMSKIIEGVVTGIGFVGAGAILKLSQEREIRGLTTAAGIWTTAAIGIAVGLGHVWIAVLSTFVVWVIMFIIGRVEHVWGLNQDRA